MRLVFFNTFWTVILDIAAWFVIHMGVVMLMLRIPPDAFDPDGFPYRPGRWEMNGDIYSRLFRIKKWKERVPDGAAWFRNRGFPKRRLKSRSPSYLQRFLLETCRAELTHWMIIAFAPFFFLWNRFYVGLIMILYALVENLPLIAVQRYNRHRLSRLVPGIDESDSNGHFHHHG